MSEKVQITYGNGNLGGAPSTNDEISGMILTGATVATANKVTVGEAYAIYSVKDAEALGIEATGTNIFAHTQIKDFYSAFSEGKELWIMLAISSVTMEDMMDKAGNYAPKLRDAAKGKIRRMACSRKSAAGVTVADGLDEDVNAAMIKAQAFAEESAEKNMPLRYIIDGKDWNGVSADLIDFNTTTFNRGNCFLGALTTGKNAAIGFLLGLMTSLPVMRKVSRVKNGALPITAAYFTNGATTESLSSVWETLEGKGYMFFREHTPGKTGYFINADRTATGTDDDYRSFVNGFVADKAASIAYSVYLDEIDDEIDYIDGKIHPAEVKVLEELVENAIVVQMGGKAGEISNVEATINPQQNVLATEIFQIALDITPKGYKGTIKVDLGFTVG